jgi:hypothetical protein
VNIVWLENRMRIPVPYHRDIDVVADAAAGDHGVELLPGFLTGNDAMHGVGGDTLGAVHGGRVPELRGGLDVLGGRVTVRPLRACRTLKPPVLVRLRMVHRSPFLTQSVAEMRTLRSFLRVMIRSPTLARLPSASSTCLPGVLPARRWSRAR